jgi:hypothetical protein
MQLRLLRALPLVLAVPLAAPYVQGCGPVSSALSAPGPSDDASADGSHTDAQAQATGGGSSGSFSWDASACAPGDVQTFRPGDYVPANAPRIACTGTEIDDLYTLCFGAEAYKDPSACYAWESAHAGCFDCVVTMSTATSYGPVIDYSGFVEANVAGCIELVSHGTACAKPVEALASCELAACEANCPVRNSSTLTSFEGCTTQADVEGCQAYAQQASCFSSQSDAGPLSVCAATDFWQFFRTVAPLFCASAPSGYGDAGGPAMLDASTD